MNLADNNSGIAKVLVIDDDPVMREYVSALLRIFDIHSKLLPDALFICQVITEYVPDVILMDIVLNEEGDGREICQRLKLQPDYVVNPVVLISSYPMDPDSIADCGACGFLPKPFQKEDLMDVLLTARFQDHRFFDSE